MRDPGDCFAVRAAQLGDCNTSVSHHFFVVFFQSKMYLPPARHKLVICEPRKKSNTLLLYDGSSLARVWLCRMLCVIAGQLPVPLRHRRRPSHGSRCVPAFWGNNSRTLFTAEAQFFLCCFCGPPVAGCAAFLVNPPATNYRSYLSHRSSSRIPTSSPGMVQGSREDSGFYVAEMVLRSPAFFLARLGDKPCPISIDSTRFNTCKYS